MSKFPFIASVAIATVMTSVAFAATPTARDTGTINYAGIGDDLGAWHGALYAGTATRNAQFSGSRTAEIDFSRYNVILGYDLTRWLTIYGLAGAANADADNRSDDSSSGLFGAGFWAGLLEVDQLSFLTTISRYRVNSGAEISYAGFDEFSWTQFDGFLTLELQNELNNTSSIFPDNIGLFFGPVVSFFESDEYDSDSDNLVGMTVGVNLMFTDDTYLTGAGDFFSDDSSVYGMMGVRF